MNRLLINIEKIKEVLSKKDNLTALEIDLIKKYTLDFYDQLTQDKNQPELMVNDFQNMPSFEAPKPITEIEHKEEIVPKIIENEKLEQQEIISEEPNIQNEYSIEQEPAIEQEIIVEEIPQPILEDIETSSILAKEEPVEEEIVKPILEENEEIKEEIVEVPEVSIEIPIETQIPLKLQTPNEPQISIEPEKNNFIQNTEIRTTPKVETIVAKPTVSNSFNRIEDLKKAISIQKKFEFIKSLFGNDHESYAKAIHQLNNMTNLEVAQSYLTEIQIKQNWNEEDKLAIELTDLVNRRYS